MEEEKVKLDAAKTDHAKVKTDLEKEILTLSSKLHEQEQENAVLKDRLNQEIRLKEEYHMSFKRA